MDLTRHSLEICNNEHPPLEPPGFKMLLVLFDHTVALEAAAVTQPLHDLHQSDLAVKEKRDAQTGGKQK